MHQHARPSGRPHAHARPVRRPRLRLAPATAAAAAAALPTAKGSSAISAGACDGPGLPGISTTGRPTFGANAGD